MTPLPDPTTTALAPPSTGDPREVLHAPEALAPFVDARVLGPADVHVAEALARHGGDDRPEVLLAVALAVRAPRRRHVCVDLTTVRDRVVTELVDTTSATSGLAPPTGAGGTGGGRVDGARAEDAVAEALLAELPWPDPSAWHDLLTTSPLVAVRDPATLTEPDDDARDVAPLTLAGDRLDLDRYWRYERRVAAALDARSRRTAPAPVGDPDPAGQPGTAPSGAEASDAEQAVVASLLAERFDGAAPDRQRVAAATAVRGGLTVLAGGPGTGKTTTVAQLLRVLAGQARAAGAPRPQVALAAPTGKAAARLSESLREAADRLDADDPDLPLLRDLSATTLHRLLGARGTSSRFRRTAAHPLPHDVVVVDETSMVPLALLAKLLDAVRADARLVLVGDPHQLASVEAGSVLADVVGDPDAAPTRSASAQAELAATAGAEHLADTVAAEEPGLHDAVVVLDRVHRYGQGTGLDRFATAVRHGDADAAVAVLRDADDLAWLETPDATSGPPPPLAQLEAQLAPVRSRLARTGQVVLDAARRGDGAAALAALDEVRILCAHRRGRHGVAGWVPRCEAWLRADVGLDPTTRWYLGRPVLVTGNDRRLQLWNGDLGVVVAAPGGDGVRVAFPGLDGEAVRLLTVARVGEVETVHAMTVHKAQGSQVSHAVVVLPEPASRLCTRELLYTAVTRAREGATVVASEAALRATIAVRTQRASGLGAALGR